MKLPERVKVLSDMACEVWEAAIADGWSPSAASDTLATVDALVAALTRIGPETEELLAPALAATAKTRTLFVRSQDARGPPACRARPGRTRLRSRRHTVPEFWITRVAEQLWWGAQEDLGGPLADMFAALPPRGMEEAVLRRLQGEVWHAVLEDLTRRVL
ncbi:hypothetical protein [Streptomyces sp. NPDC088146]|uniref:hypothetical protein n=1 Tax=Streptomyces sp. NPDC088146 TaxID=3365829 RepID=UPI003811F31B